MTASKNPSPIDQHSWNSHVSHPLQSWEWGEFRQAMGIDVVRAEHWQLTFHPIPHTPWTIGYFPKGPEITKTMLDTLTDIGKRHRAICIQLEPNTTKQYQHIHQTFSSLVPAHHPLFTQYTFVLDLTKSEEKLLSDMHSKTRYNLRLAAKRGVIVKQDNSKEAFARYLELNEETTERQGFYAHNRTYHKKMWEYMAHTGSAKLFTATYEGTVLAAWIIFIWNKTLYYPYGASSRNNRDVMAPTLLLWEIARWGKKHGYTSFDLWGALGPQPDVHDPWYGFHRFKQGFNPSLVTFSGSFDLVIHPMLYRLYTLANTIRWHILTLKKRLGKRTG